MLLRLVHALGLDQVLRLGSMLTQGWIQSLGSTLVVVLGLVDGHSVAGTKVLVSPA